MVAWTMAMSVVMEGRNGFEKLLGSSISTTYDWLDGEAKKQHDLIVIDKILEWLMVISGLYKLGIYGTSITLIHFYTNKGNCYRRLPVSSMQLYM